MDPFERLFMELIPRALREYQQFEQQQNQFVDQALSLLSESKLDVKVPQLPQLPKPQKPPESAPVDPLQAVERRRTAAEREHRAKALALQREIERKSEQAQRELEEQRAQLRREREQLEAEKAQLQSGTSSSTRRRAVVDLYDLDAR